MRQFGDIYLNIARALYGGGISNGCAQVNTDLTIRFDCLQDVIWGLTQAGDEACLQFAYLLLLCGEV